MEVKFLSQPLASSESLDTFIDILVDPEITTLSVVTAWAKRSGLARVEERLSVFRARGGTVQMIVGVSEGGATKEGLQLAMEVSDEVFVFHDPRRTFHPKVFLAGGASRREMLVGSSNMTAGGLGWNYESSLWLSEVGTTISEPFTDASQWIKALLVQPMSCKRLDASLLSDLLSSADIRIGSEAAARRVSMNPNTPEDSDSIATGSVKGLFSASAMVMRQLPKRPDASIAPAVSPSSPMTPTGASAAPSATPTPPLTTPLLLSAAPVIRRWSRDLDNTAAQQVLSSTSNPTGNLRLTQAGHGLRHETYFYNDLFGGLPWAPTFGKATEQEVLVDFDCIVGSTTLGIVTLRISHDPSRISGQANVPSVLHWGPTLGAMLRGTNFVGQFITIERLADGSFRLTITPAPSGPFLA
jgi:hypothetical protein